MIPLPTTPTTADALVAALRALLAQAITTRDDTVTAAGDLPHLSALTVDVTNAAPLPNPTAPAWVDAAAGRPDSEFTITAFQVVGRPFGASHRPVEIDVTARDARGQFVRAPDGRTALRLAGCADGRLRAAVAKATVEAAILTEGNKAAKAQGVELKDVQLAWQTTDPRTLTAQVTVKAKKGFLPAANLRLRGTLHVDATLVARVSGLGVDGDGMVGQIGASFLRPKLQQAEGMTRSLLSVPLDDLRVRDVRLTATDAALTVEADFT
jgi:hypothetical protein